MIVKENTANLVLLWSSFICGILAIIFAFISYSDNESMKFASISLGIAYISITLTALSNFLTNKRNIEVDNKISEMKEQLNRIENSVSNLKIDNEKNKEINIVIEKKATQLSFSIH